MINDYVQNDGSLPIQHFSVQLIMIVFELIKSENKEQRRNYVLSTDVNEIQTHDFKKQTQNRNIDPIEYRMKKEKNQQKQKRHNFELRRVITTLCALLTVFIRYNDVCIGSWCKDFLQIDWFCGR